MGTQHVLEWISLYESGSSTTTIAKQYGIHNSTVSRNLRRYITLRDRLVASIVASTRYPKTPFSGDKAGVAFLAGLVEDFHVRKSGRLIELNSTTTHPAMTHLFRQFLTPLGHPTLTPGYNPRGYYQYRMSAFLHDSFEPFLRKSENMPAWVPQSTDDPEFRSYLSGLIAAEGCVRLYCANSRAHAVLHITLNKRALLGQLSRIIGGHLYEVQRAWRLVIYGKAVVELLHFLDIRHQEKVEKARLVTGQIGEKWYDVERLWLELVTRIKFQVNQYKAQARLEYIEKHGIPHPAESKLSSDLMSRDPVCGMMVDEKKAKFTTSREGKTIYFCSAACKTSFDKNPQRYVHA